MKFEFILFLLFVKPCSKNSLLCCAVTLSLYSFSLSPASRSLQRACRRWSTITRYALTAMWNRMRCLPSVFSSPFIAGWRQNSAGLMAWNSSFSCHGVFMAAGKRLQQTARKRKWVSYEMNIGCRRGNVLENLHSVSNSVTGPSSKTFQLSLHLRFCLVK